MPIRPMQVKISLGVGAGWDWAVIRGSGLLFLTNLVAIILSSFLIFSSMNMDIAKVSSRITDWQRENEKLDDDRTSHGGVDERPVGIRTRHGRAG